MANEYKAQQQPDVKVGAGTTIADKPGVVKVSYDLPRSVEYPEGKTIPLTVTTK